MTEFEKKVAALRQHHEELLSQKNEPVEWGNGIYEKYKFPILTADQEPYSDSGPRAPGVEI